LARCPPCASLFPYTTLFRSEVLFEQIGDVAFAEITGHLNQTRVARDLVVFGLRRPEQVRHLQDLWRRLLLVQRLMLPLHSLSARSEEHTSELQSRENLVCRL